MSDYIDSLEFMISNNMETSEETKDIVVVNDDIQQKDFSSSWLKIQEKNLIQLGGSKLYDPAQNSYLVYKCVSVISENIATVPIILLDKNTKNPIPYTDPIYRNFYEPNPYDNFDDFMSAVSTFYTLYGEAFITVIPETSKKWQMWVLDPRLMKEVINKNSGMLMGWVYNKDTAFELDEIIHIKRRNPYNQWRGLSPLVASAVELNIDYRSSKYQDNLLVNGAVPGGLITIPENAIITEEEMKKIRKTWQNRHQGPDRVGKVAVLKAGLTYTPIAMENDKMQFIDSRKFTREAILMTFGVPAVVAGITEGVNRTSAEAQLKLFWRVTIKPQLERINSKIMWDILPRFYPNVASAFDYRKIDELQKDFTNDAEVAKKFFSMGFSRNEMNRRFDFGFEEDTDTGDIRYIPLNLVDASLRIYAQEGKLGEGGNEDGPDVDPSDNLPLPNQARSVNDIKIKVLIPKIRNFFKDEKKRLVKMIANSEKADKSIIKDINSFIINEKKRFSVKFIPYFREIILTKQMEMSEIDTIDVEQIELDMDLFEQEFKKILSIFPLIFNEIASKIVDFTENKDKCIKTTKSVYSELSKSLESNLIRFNQQIVINE